MIEQLSYRSLIRTPPTDAVVSGILGASVWNNARNRITGALGFTAGRYIQVLEGPPKALDGLIAVLRGDPRHSDLVIPRRRMVTRRSFPGWSMARVDLEELEPAAAATLALADDLDPVVDAFQRLVRSGQTAVA